MDIQAIASRTILASFHGTRARFTRKHREETRKVNQEHGTGDAAKVNVTQCEHPLLEAWDTIVEKEGRTFFDAHTRPTIDKGLKMIVKGAQMKLVNVMAGIRARAMPIKDQFMAIYPQLRLEAPTTLNGLFDPRPWKEPEVIEAKFHCDTRFLPMPLDGEWKDWAEASVMTAQLELKDRLEEAIRHVVTRCAKQQDGSFGRLHTSVFDNLKELIDLVPDLDLEQDPVIAKIIAESRNIAEQDKDELVKNPKDREAIAAEANRILGMFGKK